MDKNEYRICEEEIQENLNKGNYEEAARIADTVDWRYVREGITLCLVSDVYKKCKRYEDARNVLSIAYQRNPSGRMILYSMCELSIKLRDVIVAEEFFKEYRQVAPKDPNQYILKYKILELRDKPLEDQIHALESLQKLECKEKWMYELAYLYYRAGRSEDCVEECTQLIIFFGEGKYVIKALELKSLFVELSEQEINLYERLTGTGAASAIQIEHMGTEEYNAIDGQKELADNLKEVMDKDETVTATPTPTEVFRPYEEPEIPIGVEVIEAAETVEIGNVEEVPSDVPEEVVTVEAASEVEKVSEDTEGAKAPSDGFSQGHKFDSPVFNKDEMFPDEDITEITADSVALFTGSDSDDIGSTRIFDRKEIENALGGSEVVSDDTGRIIASVPDEMLSVEGSGQLNFVVPDEEPIEKQITGQICIDDVLLEWERLKQEKHDKWEEDFSKSLQERRENLLKEFGTFDEFEDKPEEPVKEVSEEFVLIEEEVSEEPSEDVSLEEAPLDEQAAGEVVEEEPVKDENIEEKSEVSFDTGDITEISFEEVVEEEPEAFEEVVEEAETPEDEVVEETVEVSEEVVEKIVSEETVEEEPTPEELSFDRTEFIDLEQKVTDNAPEPAFEDNTSVLPMAEDIDYLLQYAEASEAHDKVLEQAAVIEPVADVENVDISEVSEEKGEEKKEEKPEVKSEAEPVSDEDNKVDEEMAAAEEEIDEEFTEDQKARFENFLYTENTREQIKEALSTITLKAGTGNVIIGSKDSDGAIELGKAFIMELSNVEEITGKVAKIKATGINTKGVAKTFENFSNGAIIVLDANELMEDSLREFIEFIENPENSVFVVFTVSDRKKHKFIMEHNELLESFTGRIDVESLTDDELVSYAKNYALEREYVIDEMGCLALNERIDEMQTNSHDVTITEVKGLVDEAIRNVSRKTVGHFVDIVFGKRYDSNYMIKLGEKDFARK